MSKIIENKTTRPKKIYQTRKILDHVPDALSCDDDKTWLAACDKSLLENETWILIPRPMYKKSPNRCSNWVFKTKFNQKDKIQKFKADCSRIYATKRSRLQGGICTGFEVWNC